jgi:hypothetical protein
MGKIREFLNGIDKKYEESLDGKRLFLITAGACLIILAFELAIA